jgi:hypothetical protein
MTVLLIGLMIASLLIESWIYVEINDDDTFKGGLTRYNEPKDDSYKDSKEDTCDSYDKLKEEYDKIQGFDTSASKLLLNIANSQCKMLKSLLIGGQVFIGLEISAIFSLVLWIAAQVFYCVKGKALVLAYFSSCFGLFLHLAGIASFMVLTNTLYGSCDDFPTNGNAPRLCATVGPSIAIAVFFGLGLETIVFFVVACKLQRSEGFSGLSKHGERHETQAHHDKNVEEINQTKIHNINDSLPDNNEEVFKTSGRGQGTDRLENISTVKRH